MRHKMAFLRIGTLVETRKAILARVLAARSENGALGRWALVQSISQTKYYAKLIFLWNLTNLIFFLFV